MDNSGGSKVSSSRVLLFRIVLLALLIAVPLLLLASCGEQGVKESGEQEVEQTGEQSVDVTNTTENADLTESMYDQVEMGMSYQDVVNIVGQDPNRSEEVPDEVRETGKVLKCTWEGKPGTGEYEGESRLDVSFYEGEVCEVEATNL